MNVYPHKVGKLIPLLDEAIKAAHAEDLEKLATDLAHLEHAAQKLGREALRTWHTKRARRK